MDKSKIVTTNQKGIHENLEKVLSKYSLDNYQRPIPSFSKECFSKIKSWVGSDSFILDLGCGIGESSYYLSQKYPGIKILGIDKSLSRIERNNSFKTENENVLLLRGEILDLVPLFYKELKGQVLKLYILYPNPWPKSTHYKKRFHFNPIMPFLISLSDSIILRSNWQLYLEEFNEAFFFYKGQKSEVVEIKSFDQYMTPFEKKYVMSDQAIFELRLSYEVC